MKSKLLALAAVAFFAAGSAQAVNMGDGNISDEVFNVYPGFAYDVPYSFVLTDPTSLYATAISRYSDVPNLDFNFVKLFNESTMTDVATFAFSNALTDHLFANLAAGNYTYHVYGTPSSFGDSMPEITFNSAVVPEPETYAMLMAGLGVVGFAARKRKAA